MVNTSWEEIEGIPRTAEAPSRALFSLEPANGDDALGVLYGADAHLREKVPQRQVEVAHRTEAQACRAPARARGGFHVEEPNSLGAGAGRGIEMRDQLGADDLHIALEIAQSLDGMFGRLVRPHGNRG